MKRRDEISVGIVFTLAVVLVLTGGVWLARGGLASGYPLYTRFTWGQNLKQGQPVLLAGVNVGYVDDVVLRPDGYLDVTMRVHRGYHVPRAARAAVQSIGVFGDVEVALTVKPGSDLTQAFAPGDTIPAGTALPGVAQILSQADSVSTELNAIIRTVQTQVIDAGALNDLQKTIKSTAALSAQLQQIAANQNRNLTNLLAAYQRVAQAIDSAQVDSTVHDLRATSARAAVAAARFDTAAAQVNEFLARANNPNGSLGLLMSDSTLYRNLRNALATADSLMADIKAHPGRYISVHIF